MADEQIRTVGQIVVDAMRKADVVDGSKTTPDWDLMARVVDEILAGKNAEKKDPKTCKHEDFLSQCVINRLEDTGSPTDPQRLHPTVRPQDPVRLRVWLALSLHAAGRSPATANPGLGSLPGL